MNNQTYQPFSWHLTSISFNINLEVVKEERYQRLPVPIQSTTPLTAAEIEEKLVILLMEANQSGFNVTIENHSEPQLGMGGYRPHICIRPDYPTVRAAMNELQYRKELALQTAIDGLDNQSRTAPLSQKHLDQKTEGNFKLQPMDHSSYRDMALESDIVAGMVATGRWPYGPDDKLPLPDFMQELGPLSWRRGALDVFLGKPPSSCNVGTPAQSSLDKLVHKVLPVIGDSATYPSMGLDMSKLRISLEQPTPSDRGFDRVVEYPYRGNVVVLDVMSSPVHLVHLNGPLQIKTENWPIIPENQEPTIIELHVKNDTTGWALTFQEGVRFFRYKVPVLSPGKTDVLTISSWGDGTVYVRQVLAAAD